jgi:hypothetical protein
VLGGYVGPAFALAENAESVMGLREIGVDAPCSLEMEPRPREVAALHFDQAEVGERFDEARVVLEGQSEPSFSRFEVSGGQCRAACAVQLDGLGGERRGAGAAEGQGGRDEKRGETGTLHDPPSACHPESCAKNVRALQPVPRLKFVPLHPFDRYAQAPPRDHGWHVHPHGGQSSGDLRDGERASRSS